MKRIYFFIGIFLALSHLAMGQTIYWSEDFEGSTSTWSVDAGTWEMGIPTSGPNSAYNGQKCAATVLDGNYPDNADSRLISPVFIVPDALQNPRLRFWQWFNFHSYGGDYGIVQIKPQGSTSWIDLSDHIVNSGSNVWTYPSYDLSAYSGQSVQIAFYFYSDGGSALEGWYIDDILIVTGPMSFNNPETWENGLGDWYSDKGTWEVGIPSSGPGKANAGTQCAATVLNGNYANRVESKLISPVFIVPDALQNPRLRFWQWFNFHSYGGDYGIVQIKPQGSTSWIDLSDHIVNSGSNVWTYPSYDLSAYSGQSVQIAFYFYSDGGSALEGWYIDDILIVTGPMSFNNPETWENGLGDWYSDKGTWEVGIPSSGPGKANAGTQCAATVLNGNYANRVESKLISPVFIVPDALQNPRLRFWQWFNFHSYGGDYGIVQIKPQGSTSWIDLSDHIVNSGSNVWTYPSFDLSAYSGQSVQIAFYFYSDGGSALEGWYIDDILIVTGPMSFNNPETWENGLGDWYSDKGTWEVGIPSSGPGKANAGTQCAATVLNGNYANRVESKLISPVFIVPDALQNPRLRFWQWFNFHSYGGDYGIVQIKPQGSTSWIDLSDHIVNSGSNVWTYPSFDLSAYSGQSVQIAFYFYSDGGSALEGWYIDDILIVTGPMSFNNPETWENGLGDWYSDKGTWEVGIPSSGPGKANAGTQCAATVLNGNYANRVESKLISPVFIVPDALQNPRLRFWQWFNFHSYGGDYGIVQIKPQGSTSWIDLSDHIVNSGSNVWTYPSFDLSAYSGQSVQIAFYFYSDGGSALEGWYIDDILIVTGPMSFNNPETWENGLGDWYSDKGTWEVGIPSSGPGKANAGTQCAATVLNGNYANRVESKLISPVFIVPDALQNPRLRFWQWFNFHSYGGDYGIVQIKPQGSTSWIDLSDHIVNSGSNVWTYPSFDLSAYSGQSVQIAFYFYSDGGSALEGWYIDDISIEYIRYHNAGVTKIISPDTIVALNDNIYPKAIVKNFGLLADTIPVHFSIYPIYTDSTSIFLQPDQSDTVTFNTWFPEVQSTYTALCYTKLATDELITNDSLTKTVLVSSGKLEIHSITPNKGGNTGYVTVEINGAGFMPGAIVKLKRNGQQDIIADTAFVDTINYDKITTTFVFDNAALGLWSLVIINPNSDSTTFFNGFIIEPRNKLLWINITGPSTIRAGVENTYIISYGNAGNINSESPEIIIWFPKNCIGTLYENASNSAYIMDSTVLQAGYTSDVIGFLAILPRLSENETGKLYLKLKSPALPNTFSLHIRIADDLYMPSVSFAKSNYLAKSTNSVEQTYSVCTKLFKKFEGTLFGINRFDHPIIILPEFDSSGNPTGKSKEWTQESKPFWDNLISGYSPSLEMKFTNPPYNWNIVAEGCVQLNYSNIVCLKEKLERYETHITHHQEQPFKNLNENKFDCIGILESAAEQCGINSSNGFIEDAKEKTFYEGDLWRQAFNMTDRKGIVIIAQDDDMEAKRKNANNSLQLTVVTSIDPNDKIGSLGFGNQHYILPEEPLYYIIRFENVDSATASAQYVGLTDTLDTHLNWSSLIFDNSSHNVSSITFDSITGVIKWEFNNINLPPNVTPPEGEGWVLYSVKQKEGLATGTQIKNKASIIFDYNPPIITNEWINTIDRGAPTSSVSKQTTHLDSTSYVINWSGQDDNLGSGIKEYAIYYSGNPDSTYVLWKTTAETSAVFTGKKDSTYYFYSVATDNVGHIEAHPVTFDLALTTVDPSGIHETKINNSIKIFPNPANTQINVGWENQNNIEYGLTLMNMYGKELINFKGIKTDNKIIDISNLKSGVYIIQLTGNGIYSSKFIKIE